ncbi:hypothetical protein DPMN_084735 [Dreissena polymorpha]|uniref:EGF-like domain-containing protein n=1 Tax=Dreissena polymorpha TaxID=45954 RepID=A0A9D3YB34_DREPO|nr:hypothetical protein DPMN_084735 [Dreissena polymorpha]
MLSPIFIYGSALLLASWHFVEGQHGEKHTLVKRGAAASNCWHLCPGGDWNCPYGSCIYCPTGWTGQYCTVIDCAWSGYCNDRGTCVPTSSNTDYTCSNCASGMKGKSCHLVDCSSKVYCYNGGTCMGDVNGGTDYRCI